MANDILRGNIEKKYQKEIDTVKGKATRTAYKVNGVTLSTLDTKLGNFNEGDVVEIAYVVSGDFKNIVDMGLSEEDMSGNKQLSSTPASTPNKSNFSEANSRRIVRQNALTQANEFLKLIKDKVSEKVSDDMLSYLFEVAKKCEDWVYREEDK